MTRVGGFGRVLREMVIEYLREHRRQEFTPSARSKALARSSGAIANICGSSDPVDGELLNEEHLSEVLVDLEAEGLVKRAGDRSGGTPEWRWAGPSPEPTPTDEDAPKAKSARQRLRPGELRTRVLDYVCARPHEELSPTAVARALEASAGAVSNALERLVETGEIARKSDSPRRFSSASKRR